MSLMIDFQKYGLNEKSIKYLSQRMTKIQNSECAIEKLNLRSEMSGYLSALHDVDSLLLSDYLEILGLLP